ncbi:MAG TPA: hypothetical protein V6C95_02760 [Coleofasciculaceae cyanobacterium]
MNSQFFQAVADLLRHIESLNVPSDQYGVLDGGQTLEVSKALHERIQGTPEFTMFESVGGSWYCYDEFDEWVVVEPGVTAAAIAELFEVS